MGGGRHRELNVSAAQDGVNFDGMPHGNCLGRRSSDASMTISPREWLDQMANPWLDHVPAEWFDHTGGRYDSRPRANERKNVQLDDPTLLRDEAYIDGAWVRSDSTATFAVAATRSKP